MIINQSPDTQKYSGALSQSEPTENNYFKNFK